MRCGSIAAAVMLVMTAAPAVARGQAPTAAGDREWRVTKIGDDGSAGTLRWAIEGSAANAGRDVIVIDPEQGQAIVVTSPLPKVRSEEHTSELQSH